MKTTRSNSDKMRVCWASFSAPRRGSGDRRPDVTEIGDLKVPVPWRRRGLRRMIFGSR